MIGAMRGVRVAGADANSRWAEMLARWAIPDELRAAAGTTPYFFDPQVFAQAADEALGRAEDSPSDEVAREALPTGGSVLDVGCGAGAASLRLRPDSVVGVDTSGRLLHAFASRAASLGIVATTVEGVWPDVAERSAPGDVVVCHHVFYNVADLNTFAAALDRHARERVVVELTAVHPMAWMAIYWKGLHGLARPDRPIAEDALAVLSELGLKPHHERWSRPYQMIGEHGRHRLESMARRLCLPPERHAELDRLLKENPPPVEREVVTIWW